VAKRTTIKITPRVPRAPFSAPPSRVHHRARRPQKVGEPFEDGTPEFQKPEYRFCPRCGTLLEPALEHDVVRPTCPECGFIVYYNPAPAVGAVITREGEILLVKRAHPPKEGLWSLPAGFMEFGEKQLDALAREVREETGIEIRAATLLSVEDAADDPRTHALLIAFIADEWEGEPRPGDDASEVRWWPVGDLPQMAWQNHVRVVEKAREWLGL